MENKINVVCPNCGVGLTIEKKSITSAKERIEALKNAGVDVSNLFAMTGANGGDFIASNRNGNLEILSDDDPIFQYLATSGTVPNRKLFRRWVMAQMFHMLSVKNGATNEPIGFTNILHRRGYEYSWKQLQDELYAQVKMHQHDDIENFIDRNHFFNKHVAYAMAMHYIKELKKIVNNKKVKKCKGVPYVTIGGRHIFKTDVHKKLYSPLLNLAWAINSSQNPEALFYAVQNFNKQREKLNWNTPQCPKWVDSYKGAGAYFTLQNMIRFHGCFLWNDENQRLSKSQSLVFLDQKAGTYAQEGWRLLGLLKKAITDNNIEIEAKVASWHQ
nr:MAG TPA: hypothetical protein [Caudoviricetes sp.]